MIFKKIGLSVLALLLIATTLFGFIPAQPVKAGTETYNHIIPFTVTDTSGVARTNVPVIIAYDTSGKLVAYGLVNATATNTYVAQLAPEEKQELEDKFVQLFE